MKSWRERGKVVLERAGLGAKALSRRVRDSRHDNYDERPRLCETLFPWPVRLGIVASAWLLARIWLHTGAAGQLGWTLEYAGVVAISLAASLWFFIFLADVALAVAWFAFTFIRPRTPQESPYLYWTHQAVELCNRQFSHIEAFWIWLGVLLPCAPRIDIQIPALIGLALLGPALVDWITLLLHPGVSRASGELQSARRPVIYTFIFLGVLILLVWRSPGQRMSLVPLAGAVAVGLVVRSWRHVRRRHQAKDHPDKVQTFRRQQRRLTGGLDVLFGPGLMLAGLVGLLVLSLWLRHRQDHVTAEALDGPLPDREACVAEPGGPVEADVSLFLVADSQIHELGGERFPGQTELADLLVPSAVRPVELDMLGAASVARLHHMFEEVVRDAGKRPVFWAHLGDFADLSCTGEILRAADMFSSFGRQKLVGVAPGNHDMSFTGNFLWSPYWTGACRSSRADKVASLRIIGSLLDPRCGVVAKEASVSGPEESLWPSWLTGTGGLVTVTPLGSVRHRGQPRSVVAIFVDTGDDATFDWGLAGLFGTYSRDQDRRLRARVQDLKATVTDPLWLVFAHHPLGEMTRPSRARLESTLAWLDGDPLGTGTQGAATLEPEPRVLAMIAAHTHRAETHRVCVAGRVVREIVVGSTIDAPQQGAILELGTDQRGLASARLRTVATIARPGFTCGTKPATIDAEVCQRIVARLKRDPDCEPLFDEGQGAARDCSELEQPSDLGDTLRELMSSSSPVEPRAIRQAQTLRARRLMTCVCRKNLDASAARTALTYQPPFSADGSCRPPSVASAAVAPGPAATGLGFCEPIARDGDPLDDDVFARRIDQRLASGGEEAAQELACLSWAASAQQLHKAMGMTFASALRCAFDDRTIPAAQESVATLDVQPCR